MATKKTNTTTSTENEAATVENATAGAATIEKEPLASPDSRPPQRAKLEMIAIEKLRPHPDNPRVVEDDEVVEQLTYLIREAGGMSERYAPTVRKLDDHYQILSGHRRFKAAGKAEIAVIPCWVVEDMSDEDAMAELVRANTQTGLSPFEIGLHVLKAVPPGKGGRGKTGGLSGFARKIGMGQSKLSTYRKAASVFEAIREETHLTADRFCDKAYQLVEIANKLPDTLWPPVVKRLVDEGWSLANLKTEMDYGQRILDETEGKWQDVFLPQSEVQAAFWQRHPVGSCVESVGKLVVEADLAEEVILAAVPDDQVDEKRQEFHDWLKANTGGDSWEAEKIREYAARHAEELQTPHDGGEPPREDEDNDDEEKDVAATPRPPSPVCARHICTNSRTSSVPAWKTSPPGSRKPAAPPRRAA